MSTKAKHTPGPWGLSGGAPSFVWAGEWDGPHGTLIADLSKSDVPFDERKANAQLIAAAPDLLEALQWVLPPADECERCKRGGSLCVGHAAIAKAEGKP